jgi:hypothetical protein
VNYKPRTGPAIPIYRADSPELAEDFNNSLRATDRESQAGLLELLAAIEHNALPLGATKRDCLFVLHDSNVTYYNLRAMADTVEFHARLYKSHRATHNPQIEPVVLLQARQLSCKAGRQYKAASFYARTVASWTDYDRIGKLFHDAAETYEAATRLLLVAIYGEDYDQNISQPQSV